MNKQYALPLMLFATLTVTVLSFVAFYIFVFDDAASNSTAAYDDVNWRRVALSFVCSLISTLPALRWYFKYMKPIVDAHEE
ncbi:MAG: uncharacterized membrane protein YbhN (UPF0104 family) [Neolewinella sp.]|jgi:uncharacterized membrane protein YbhN (UPF0104 family)